ncbi:thioredoxin domain-containing protein [Aureispira anguillae]|uniref:Thioredoxin domain-containing protein n=1 Tax=Aureispira anguillae TaxID=2864201 RepID=A0A915YIY5_9BACT|nr:thioredoxin domain-containing protein [Aureispira anguillae]BDS14039.1 thioredoxin domain-containing protein [Aureispira anguillae]
MKAPNRLIHESSPYLQQHAYNPVDWYPWGKEALDKAQQEDKPILVSIGYSTCHWCHVMERESFENEEIADFMNAHFINIKVDREERPDIDAIYMEAVQLLQNGQGGWPLNCFLMPDGRPFFGGTYFPPTPAYRRASWMQVLKNLSTAYANRRADVEEQASRVLHHIQQAQTSFSSTIPIADAEVLFDVSSVQNTFEQLQKGFDQEHGGFGGAPKFPGTMPLRFCLNYYLAKGDEQALNQLLLSLDKMAMGGIYDHLGGGFSRYTVDERWLVPHFEKMLYDNALLVALLADAYKLTKSTLYQQRIQETLDWVEREMLSEEGGFYAALDADSEGEEGKFYVWNKSEIEELLGEDSALFCAYYDVSEEGNWETKNILNIPIGIEDFMQKMELSNQAETETFLLKCRTKLLAARAQRIRPGLDDKVLLDWNAMMITAYCKAYQALGIEAYKKTALKALHFVLEQFAITKKGLHLFHSYKNGQAQHHAFLDDYALLIEALIEIYAITQEVRYSQLAKEYTDFVNNEFLDHQDHLYYFTSAKQQDIILHKKIIYDGATPSGNATMLHNLQRIGVLLDDLSYRKQAEKLLLVFKEKIETYPQSFGKWANALFLEVYPLQTVAVMGPHKEEFIKRLLAESLFNTFVSTSDTKMVRNISIPEAIEQTAVVICKDYTCSLPIYTVEEALDQMGVKHKML